MSIIIIALLIILITEIAVNYYGKESDFQKPDLIVVLGSGNKVDGPLLNDRLEQAIEAYRSSGVPILLTGDEKNKSEISSMLRYVKNKLPDIEPILDCNSLKTWDSFVFIKRNFPESNLLVITNEFHQRRSLFFARILNLSAKSCGKDLTFSNNWVLFIRERLARLLIYRHLIPVPIKKS